MPNIQEQFADLKHELASLTEDQWLAIPEPGDLSRRNKHMNQKADRFTPVPDSVLQGARQSSIHSGNVDYGGLETPLSSPATPDLREYGEARKQLVRNQLDRIADSVTGQTVVDPKGYLSDLNSLNAGADDVSDLKKARLLLQSIIKTNPKHGPGTVSLLSLFLFSFQLFADIRFSRLDCLCSLGRTCRKDCDSTQVDGARLRRMS